MTQIKIDYKYEVLLCLLKNEMHQRELAKKLNTSLTRIQSILKQLRDINAIDYKEIGKNHVYFIKKNLVSKSLILNAENYKLIKILRKYTYLEPIFKKLIKSSKSMILLFGSYAKGTEKKESDIDIYTEKNNNIENIYPSLSVKTGKFDRNSLLIKEIIKNHIILKGGEEYYEKLKFFD